MLSPFQPALVKLRGARAAGEKRSADRVKFAHRNLYVTAEGLWASFLCSGVDWAMQTGQRRETVITDQMHRWADLAGRDIRMRGLSTPFPHLDFAKRLYEDTPRPLQVPPGCSTFDDMVEAQQLYAIEFGARRSVTVLDVLVTDRKVRREELRDIAGTHPLGPSRGELETIRRSLAQVTACVARAGWEARPLSGRELRWVFHASAGMGAPVPAALYGSATDGWSEDEVEGFTGPVRATQAPYAPTTVVRTLRESVEHVAHVAVLHADTFEERDTERADLVPFLAWTGTLPYAVEWCLAGKVIDGADLRSSAALDRRRAKDIIRHRLDHDDDPSGEALRGSQRALEVEDELKGPREVACRFRGVLMLAVTGDSEDAALQRANDLTVAAAREQGITLHHDYGQYEAYRAFTPGELVPMAGHVTQQPAYFLATGVPNATSSAGDRTGVIFGNVAGSQDLFVFDPFGGPRRDRSGMVPILGMQGCSKSSTGGFLMDYLARRGIPAVGYDPSGPWARLCDQPHLRGNARHLSMMSAHRGILSPSILVPDPQRQDFKDDIEFQVAMDSAAAERMSLLIDTFAGMLPAGMVANDRTGRVEATLQSAVTAVGGQYGTSPWEVVDRLKTMGEAGRYVAEQLEARSSLRDGRLVFPDRVRDVDDDRGPSMMNQALLTVITMEGITLPPKDLPRSEWSATEQEAAPMLRLGSYFAARAMYLNRDPKGVFFDELGILAGGRSFGPFSVRASVDSRKRNGLIVLLGQNPVMMMELNRQIANLIGAAMVGRMEVGAARAALPFLGLAEDSGYEQVIASLQTGEYVIRDWRGRVRKVVIDRAWWDAELRAALDTNPFGEGLVDEVDDLILDGVA